MPGNAKKFRIFPFAISSDNNIHHIQFISISPFPYTRQRVLDKLLFLFKWEKNGALKLLKGNLLQIIRNLLLFDRFFSLLGKRYNLNLKFISL